MMRRRSFLNSFPFTLRVLESVILIALLSAGALAQEHGTEEQKSNRVRQTETRLTGEVEMITLRHASAEKVAEMILPYHQNLWVVPDQRTNSILLTGPETDRASARKLLAQLDQEVVVGDEDEMRVQVSQFSNVQATEELAEKLASLFPPQAYSILVNGGRAHRQIYPVNLTVDTSTNQLIARGRASDLAKLATIVEQLDQAVAKRPAAEQGGSGQYQVRLVWLVSGLDEASTADVPPDLTEVVQELEQFGITGLRRAFQTMMRVNPGDEFRAQFVAELDQRWQMLVSGEMTPIANDDDHGLPELRVSIKGEGEPGTPAHLVPSVPERGAASAGRIELQTTIRTRPGHFVVLGVTPLAQLDSVFVLQVFELE